MTLSEAVREASRKLRAAGISSPIRDSEDLMRHVTGLARHELFMSGGQQVPAGILAAFRGLVDRRALREPLQHVTGEAWFMGRRFLSGPGALVPRPETEIVFERFLEALPERPGLLLDLGTGSGVIAVSLALAYPGAAVVGSDISQEALRLAAGNSTLHGTSNLLLVSCDLLAGLGCRFDGIAANLPYIASDALDGLQPEVRFDPVVALDGGADGMGTIRRFLATAHDSVRTGGAIALEASGRQVPAIERLLAGTGAWTGMRRGRDLAGRARWITAERR